MRLKWLLGAALLLACGDDVPSNPANPYGNPDGQNNGNGNGNGTGGDGDGYQPGQDVPVSTRGLPCEVEAIVDKHCGLCHGTSVFGGAPMSLVTQADFQVTSPISGESYHSLALERIEDEDSPMPPLSQDRMPEASLATLKQWLAGGAPSSTAGCSTGEFPGGGDGDGDKPIGPQTDIEEIIYDEINPEDCDAVLDLVAFDPKDPSKGFPVNQFTANTYECFIFDVQDAEKMQGLKIETIIDDARVVHHWLLYEQAGAGTGKNDYYNCAGQHPAAALLAGWAPGRGDTQMPRGVGLRLPEKGKSTYVLEVHYNNAAGHANVRDRSGARVCATKKIQPNEAAVHWLGSEAIAAGYGTDTNVTGTCTAPKRAVVLNSWPHMHQLGRHMKVDLIRKGGSPETILDNPFSFDDQRAYDTLMILEPGDKLRTTCTFRNDKRFPFVGFGTASEDEMCYNFVLAYPAGALRNGVSLTVTDNTCIDLL